MLSGLPSDVRRAYRNVSDLPQVLASDVSLEDGRVTINLELAPGVERVPPAVLRRAAEHDFGIERVDRYEAATGAGEVPIAVLVADVGVGVGGGA